MSAMSPRAGFSRWAAAAVALCLIPAQPALAAKRPAPATAASPAGGAPPNVGPAAKEGVSHILGMLDWGASSSAVMDTVREEITGRWNQVLKDLRDPVEIDRALRRKATEFGAVEKTFVRFGGERTGYESSLIANDFVANVDEAMLRIEDKDAQRYYFFRNDRLWKVLVAYSSNVTQQTPFVDFVGQVQGKYGRPLNVDWVTPPGAPKRMVSASWDDPSTRLVVEDRTEFFGTYCMKFLSLSEGVALEDALKSKGPARSSAMDDPGVASALDEITADTGAAQDDVVDRLTGTQRSLDLRGNRPDDAQDIYQPAGQSVDDATDQGADPTRGEKKPKRKGSKPDKGSKSSGRPESAGPSKPVIIY